mgnify:CR=1 FL=1
MLIFQNDGVLPIEGFTTFGMSAKPGSTNPIGKFGTGLKNAVAIILRLGGSITVWRGEQEYVFYTRSEDFRGKSFDKVRMKRRRTMLKPWSYESLPFTTELGKHWEPWMAFRELEANTRDETNGMTTPSFGHSMDDIGYQLSRSDSTLILVDCPELDAAYRDIDNIFLPDLGPPLFENDDVRIFKGKSNHIFYRGMRVTDTVKPTLYTYEVKWCQLTEDRTSQYTFMDNDHIMRALLECDDKELSWNIVQNSVGHHEESFEWDQKNPSVGIGWYSSLSTGGLSSRFSSLRDNLHFGLGKKEAVSIRLTVKQWEQIMTRMRKGQALEQVKRQMTSAGWKPDATWNEIAEEADVRLFT